MISFENTQDAFAYRSDAELRQAKILFTLMNNPLLVKVGSRITPSIVGWKLGFVNNLVKKTIFRHFVGGETLQETAEVADKLEKYNVNVILDYGVEGGSGERASEAATKEFLRVIEYASTQSNIPFMSIKITGLVRFSLLEKLHETMLARDEDDMLEAYDKSIDSLPEDDRTEWYNAVRRVRTLCEAANQHNVGMLIDAEESWIQLPVDAITMWCMERYNKRRVLIFNTMQMYRHDRMEFIKESHTLARKRGFMLGAKLVRGAYMEKERARAKEMGYPSPIQPDKSTTDADYNKALEYCIDHINDISTIVASHNEYSSAYAVSLLNKKGLPNNHEHVYFSQLYGMSDHITFNLAKEGCRVSKYLPFGPLLDVIPYLMRRAQENTSVSGQTSRELSLIKKELKRRSAKKHG